MYVLLPPNWILRDATGDAGRRLPSILGGGPFLGEPEPEREGDEGVDELLEMLAVAPSANEFLS